VNVNHVDYGSVPCAASGRNPARDRIGTLRGIMSVSLRGIVGIRKVTLDEVERVLIAHGSIDPNALAAGKTIESCIYGGAILIDIQAIDLIEVISYR
jgi:hypothetical protein